MKCNGHTLSSMTRPIACLVTGTALLFCGSTSVQAQVILDFDNNGSIDDFEFFCFEGFLAIK